MGPPTRHRPNLSPAHLLVGAILPGITTTRRAWSFPRLRERDRRQRLVTQAAVYPSLPELGGLTPPDDVERRGLVTRFERPGLLSLLRRERLSGSLALERHGTRAG